MTKEKSFPLKGGKTYILLFTRVAPWRVNLDYFSVRRKSVSTNIFGAKSKSWIWMILSQKGVTIQIGDKLEKTVDQAK